jgi:hypothetical protein
VSFTTHVSCHHNYGAEERHFDEDLLIVRQWYFCSGEHMFLEPHDGLEIAADGRWYFLDHAGNELVRRQGFSGGGDWSLIDTSSVKCRSKVAGMPADGAPYDFFGRSPVILGNRVLIGAHNHAALGSMSGAVYAFAVSGLER